MKNKIILASLLATLSLSVTSCREEYLQSEPTSTLSNPPAQAKLYGLYRMMITPGTGGASKRHDDFGQKSYDIYMDMLSSDMALANAGYGWYRDIAGYVVTDNYTSTENYIPWRYYYRLIAGANEVIQGLGGNDATPTGEQKYSMAQAKALRAYAYFYLLQLYTNQYEPNSETNSIPLYLDTSVVAKPKAKQSEVYAQIVKDLKYAVDNLSGFERKNKGIINKYVAEGLLAYTYAAMGENDKVLSLAQDIINNGGFTLTSREECAYYDHKGTGTPSGGGFNDVNTPSWMWGYDITSQANIELVSFWGHMDDFSYGYAWAGGYKAMDENLYNQIEAGDIRKQQFPANYQATPRDTRHYQPVNKFFSASGRERGAQRVIVSDYVFMRVDEFYILGAEAAAKTGNLTEAKRLISELIKKRFSDATVNAELTKINGLSQDDLLKYIYLNTRIELWGEGKSYLSMKRNHLSVTRGSNHISHKGETFTSTDSRLTLDIPQSEINNNPYIKK